MITEAEASQKWCPQTTRHLHFQDLPDSTASTSLCIGSKCMAWRWGPKPGTITGVTLTENRYVNLPMSVETHVVPDDAPEEGFCGLAGKP